MVGQSIGHYKILEKLGAGGMGEVYRAEDTTLDREVALKVLPPELAESQERLDRFQREAKTLAALDHPNIVTIHTVEEADGVRFLTMQLVEGKRLSELIPKGGMPLEQIFDIATPLADALAAAHEKGVIHRDLKPANIMITDDGRVKVLNFGLAKLRQETMPEEATELPTEPLTEEGKILGTIPYMSPEQLEGKDLDSRSDIFSLGVILYEMATWERPFKGDSSASLIMSIGRDTPPEVDTLREELPHHLSRVIDHCLEKDPESRYQSVKDVRNELEALRKEIDSGIIRPSAEVPRVEPSHWHRWWPIAVGVAVVLVALVALWLGRQQAPSADVAEAPAQPPMIVVLPFENLGAPEDEYFADGMTEEITSRLAVVSGLRVISRTSAMQYKENRPSLKQVGEELGVDYVLEGSVRWARVDGGSRVRITPQLIRVEDDSHLWADSYDRVIEDVFEIQSDIASQVVDRLGVTLGGSEREEAEPRPTENLEAYQAYLRGMANMSQSGGGADQDWETAERMFARAVDLDPAFALAHARLSLSRSGRIWFAANADWNWGPARQAAERALGLEPDLPEAHHALGMIYYRAERDYEGALEHFAIAADGRPNDSEIAVSIAAIHRRKGDWEPAVAGFQKAAALDPRSSGVAQEHAWTLQYLRRYQEADAEYARSIFLGPDQGSAYFTRSDNRIHWTGDLQESRELLEGAPHGGGGPYSHWERYSQLWLERDYEELLKRIANTGEFRCMRCSSIYRRLYEGAAHRALGDAARSKTAYESARVELEAADRDFPNNPGIQVRLGEAYAGLGRKDAAIRSGQLAVELLPTSEDALRGPVMEEALAHIYVMVAEDHAALDLLDRLLSIPCLVSVHWLRLDPTWDTLRDHPRFQALLEKYGQEA